MPRFLLFVALALVAAGCVSPADVVPASALDRLPATGGVVVHRASGAPAAADALGPILGAVHGLGVRAFEPTLGIDAEGVLFYSAVESFANVQSAPIVMRSSDAGASWEDASPRVGPLAMPPTTNDPFLYVDVETGRVFQFAMEPILVCSVLSWSDDQGASWTTNPKGCGNTPPWDHQSMTSAHPKGVPTVGYPNVLVQCVNNDVASSCARSLDGGLTWTPGAPVVVSPDCGGLHGHPVAHPDGTVFLPKMHCGQAMVYMSADSGLTWSGTLVSDVPGHPWPDPAMAVDDAGNVYYAWVGEEGELLLSYSTDVGATWSAPVVASPPGITTHIPAIAAGSAGRVVLAYPGTADLPEGYASDKGADEAAWHGYLTLVEDALAADPLFATVRTTPAEDPLVRGACGPLRCPGMTDFIDVVVGMDGRPYASFVDVCSAECAADGLDGENDQSEAVLATLVQGPSLRVAAPG